MLVKGNFLGTGVLEVNDRIQWLKLRGIKGTADRPSGIVLQSNASGTMTDRYIWFDQDGNLRTHTSEPTDEDANGSVISGAANAGASLALDNLASVAINTDLVSDTDSTDDLGSSSKYWAEAYIDKVYLSSTSTLTGGSNVCTFDGGITIGSDGDGHDLILYGETAGQYVQWDMNGNSNAGEFILKDNVNLVFGTGSDIEIDWDTSELAINAGADDNVIVFGKASDVDVKFKSHDNANQDAGWISDIYTFQICDSAILQIGGSAFDTVTDGFQIIFDGTNTLNIDPVTANDVVRIGETTVGDFYLDGSNYDLHWDGSASEFIFNDGAKLCFGTSTDVEISYDGVDNEIDVVQNAAGTGKWAFGKNDTGMDVTFYGATSGDYMMWDESGDTLLFEDATISVAGANVTYTMGISTDELLFDGTDHANCGVTFGSTGTNAMDVTFQSITAGDTMIFDGGAKTFTLTDIHLALGDADEIRFGASGDITMEYDGTGDTLDVKQGSDGTGGIDFIDMNVAFTGANSLGTVINVTGLDTTGNSDTVVIDHSGSGNALFVDQNEADSQGITLEPYTNSTVASLEVDGDSAGWLGADGVGMVHLKDDIALGHANASMLLIDKSAAIAEINAARGSCLRIVENMNVSAAGTSYAAYISSTNNEALYVDAGKVLIDEDITVLGQFFTATDTTATNEGATIPANVSFVTADETTGDNGDILNLPTNVAGQLLIVLNDDAEHDFVLTAAAGDTINGGTAAGGITVGEDECVFLFAIDGTDWRAFKISGSGALATAGQSA